MARKLLMWTLVMLVLALSLTTGAQAIGKLVVAQEKMVVVPYYDTAYYAYVFAEVTNSGDKPVAFASGLMEVFDSDGNSLASNSIYYCYPSVLQPGEMGYLHGSSYVEAEGPDGIDDFMLSITGQGSISTTITRLETTARLETTQDTYSTYDALVAEIKNTLDTPLTSFEIIYAAKDEAGELLLVTSSYWNGYDIGILPGSSVEMRSWLDSTLTDYMRENQIVPATVEVIAYNAQ